MNSPVWRRVSRRSSVVVIGTVASLAIIVACARSGDAQVPRAESRIVADDTASLARLLTAVRGVDPLLCEMATRNVDMHGWWSGWGSTGDNPLSNDPSASALIRWIQNEHNDPAVVPRLRTAMRDSDGCVRRVAGSFLGRVEHASAVAALIDALDDPQADTRRVAAIGLGLDDDPVPGAADRVPPLTRRLRDQDAGVRQAVAWALGAIEAKGALEPLIELLQRDTDPRVRQAAAWALGRISG